MIWQVLLVAPLFKNIWSIKLDSIKRLEINPSILPQNGAPTFADVRTEGGLLDWQAYILSIDSALDIKTRIGSPAYQAFLVRGPNGSDYKCFVPIPQTNTEKALHETTVPEYEHSFKHLKNNIFKLKSSCLQLQGGHWSYEVCPFRHVRQFHREFKKGSLASKLSDPAEAGVGTSHGSNFPEGTFAGILQSILGRSEQEVISEDILLGRYIPEAANDHLEGGVYVQSYIDGDRCNDEEPMARIAEVRYECSLNKPIDHIVSVTEVSSCRYSIRVASSKMCATNVVLPRPVSTISCMKNSIIQDRIEASSEPKKTHSLGDGLSVNHDARKKPRRPDGAVFWKQRLRHFIAHDRNEYPIIHKLVMEFMQAENMNQPESGEDIPDALVKKWLLLLGINDDSIPRDLSSPSNHTDKREQRDD